MKSILPASVIAASCLGLMAKAADPGHPPTQVINQALDAFSGTWEIVSVQPAGATKDAKRLVFRKDQTYAALDAAGKELWAGTYDLDPTTTPKVWDHRSNESKKTGGDALGIYELDGDNLKVACVVGAWKDTQWTGKPRPATFSLMSADAVLELRRVKPGS